MCRVLSITNYDHRVHQDVVKRFYELARTGMVMAEDPPGHQDGWGLAYYNEGQLVVHKSGISLLEEIDRITCLLNALKTTPLMILHMRKSAWLNTSSTKHAHPFYIGNTVFFHNGVIYDYQGLFHDISLPIDLDARDTEVFFYHIMSGKAPLLEQNFLNSIDLIKHQHSYSALNCLFSDGKSLYAYRDYLKEPDYYSLYKAFADRSFLISSEPLENNVCWEEMKQEELLCIPLSQ
jgi:glutamine amidotransferase